MKSISYYKSFTILIILMVFSSVYSQNKKMFLFKPNFYHDVIKRFDDESGHFKLDVYAMIDNDRLIFVKKDSIYTASYTISAAVYDAKNDDIPLFQKKDYKKITVDNYADSESRYIMHTTKMNFKLKAGKYKVYLLLRDEISGKTQEIKRDVVYQQTGRYGVTKLTLVDLHDKSFTLNNFNPVVSNVIPGYPSEIGIFFEVFNEEKNIPYGVKYTISSAVNDQVIYKDSFSRSTTRRINYDVIRIPTKNFKMGKYKIKVLVSIAGKTFEREKEFFLRMKHKYDSNLSIKESIERMIYVADEDSIDAMLEMSEIEMAEWFDSFWKNLDSAYKQESGTMEKEYFRRVDFADNGFSTKDKAGWKTDRGKIYCTYGEPDEIQRFDHPDNKVRPYQVWVYRQIGKRFIFDFRGEEFRLRK